MSIPGITSAIAGVGGGGYEFKKKKERKRQMNAWTLLA